MVAESLALSSRRRIAGLAFAASGASIFAAVLAQATPLGSVLGSMGVTSAFEKRALASILLWILASVALLVGALFTAAALRGPKTNLTLVGCLLLGVGDLLFFGFRVAPSGLRVILANAAVTGDQAAVLDRLLASTDPLLVMVLPFLVLGGTLLGVGLERAKVSSAYAAAAWFIGAAAFAFVDGVWWAEAIAAATLALALFVMGFDLALFRPAFLTSAAAQGSGTVTRT